VEANQLSEQLRRELLRYLSATSEERARPKHIYWHKLNLVVATKTEA
jgi:hypothetical protein